MNLDLNNEDIQTDGGTFDPSKIFGYSVVNDKMITDTLDNVLISGFDTGKSQNDSPYFDIKFTDVNGNETNMREYEPDSTRTDYEKKCKTQMTRLKHIVSKYVPEGTALPAAADFPALWEGVKTLLTANKCNETPVRMKLVYNDKGYLTIPKYVPFIESMSVAKTESKLTLTDFDILTRPSADKPELATADESEDALPF